MSNVDIETSASGGARKVGGRRWLYVVLSVTLFLFLGLLYAWSVFMPPLEAEFGWTRAGTATVFSICMTCFCLGLLVAGLISRRTRPRNVVMLSSLIMGLGFFLASQSASLAGMYFSYGALVGFGVGIGYNTILSTMIKWFPDRPGIVGGIMLMGFGAGALILGPLCSWLVVQVGWRATFQSLCVFYALLFFVVSFLVKPPPAGLIFPAPAKRKSRIMETGGEVSTREMLRRVSFWIYFSWMACMVSAGYILISHAVPLAVGLDIAPATAAVMAGMISLFNGLGRLLGGAGFDAFGRKVIMVASSCGFLISGSLVWCALQTGNQAVLTTSFAVSGLSLGFAILNSAALIRTFYGLESYALNYGMVSLSSIVAAFAGPSVIGLLHNVMNSYAAMPFCMLALGGLALALALALKKP